MEQSRIKSFLAFMIESILSTPFSTILWLFCTAQILFELNLSKVFLYFDPTFGLFSLSCLSTLILFFFEKNFSRISIKASAFFAIVLLVYAAVWSWDYYFEFKGLDRLHILFGFSFIGLTPLFYKKTDLEVWHEQMAMINVGFFVFFAMILGAIAQLAIFSLIGFVFDLDSKFIFHRANYAVFVGVPALIVMHVGYARSWTKLDLITGAVIRFGIFPVWVFYTALLNIYALKILIRWQLPDGNVALPAIASFVMFFLMRWSSIAQQVEILRHRMVRYVYMLHTSIFILLAVSATRRLLDYGFTQRRYTLILVLVGCLCLLGAEAIRKFSPRWMALVIAVLIAASFYQV